MRSIFIVLLIANIGFFLHQALIAKGGESAAPVVIGSTKEIGEKLELVAEKIPGKVRKKIELQSGKVTISREKEDAKNIVDKKENAGSLCTMVGPYEQLVRAEFLVERLSALGVDSVITPVERIEGVLFWVYLAPELSQQEAMMRLYELQKKNIESYIITKGELERGISFGQYPERKEAELRIDEIRKQGYEPQVKEVNKTINETWVTMSPSSAEKISESIWLDILSAENGLERRQNFCISVASP